MSDSPNVDPDLTTDAPKDTAPDDAQQEAPDVEVTSPDEVDPDDGTDDDDVPVDNPAG
jgi:hypothetical protein